MPLNGARTPLPVRFAALQSRDSTLCLHNTNIIDHKTIKTHNETFPHTQIPNLTERRFYQAVHAGARVALSV